VLRVPTQLKQLKHEPEQMLEAKDFARLAVDRVRGELFEQREDL
jgi:hypothetical protein